MADYIPQVTRQDVVRVVLRDFPIRKREQILAILDEYGPEPWQSEPDRVHLAILKLSGGSIKKLREYTERATGDYRDVLAPAEYPGFWEVGFVGIEKMTPAQIRKLQEDDWSQYCEWLDAS